MGRFHSPSLDLVSMFNQTGTWSRLRLWNWPIYVQLNSNNKERKKHNSLSIFYYNSRLKVDSVYYDYFKFKKWKYFLFLCFRNGRNSSNKTVNQQRNTRNSSSSGSSSKRYCYTKHLKMCMHLCMILKTVQLSDRFGFKSEVSLLVYPNYETIGIANRHKNLICPGKSFCSRNF